MKGVMLDMPAYRFEVSQAPHVEKKLVEEYEREGLLVTAKRPNPREITYSDVSKLPYTAAVIKVVSMFRLARIKSAYHAECIAGRCRCCMNYPLCRIA